MSGKSYRFEIATNMSEDTMMVHGIEFYARQISVGAQLHLQRARERVLRLRAKRTQDNLTKQRKASQGEVIEIDEVEIPTVLEAEVEAIIPAIKKLVVNSLDADKVTAEWLMDMDQMSYARFFNILVTGEDLEVQQAAAEQINLDEAPAEAGDSPNVGKATSA